MEAIPGLFGKILKEKCRNKNAGFHGKTCRKNGKKFVDKPIFEAYTAYESDPRAVNRVVKI
ncbi:MAG: hypothetical protein ACI3W7_01975 [Oscillospiraceae bacterium]